MESQMSSVRHYFLTATWENQSTSTLILVCFLNKICTSSARIRRYRVLAFGCSCVRVRSLLLRSCWRGNLWRWLAGSRSMMRSVGPHSMVSGWLALPGGASFAGFPGLRVAMQRSFLWVWSDSERVSFDEVQRRILRKSWWVLSELLVVWRVCKHTRWTMERSAQTKARAKVTARAGHKAGKAKSNA